MENDLFCEVYYQADKSGVFGKKQNRGKDFFQGGIYKINQSFKEKFMKLGQRIHDKKGK